MAADLSVRGHCRKPIAAAGGAPATQLGSAPGPCRAALEGAALVLAHAAPDPGVLTGLQCPLQAGVDNGAAPADAFRFLDLQEGRAGVADGEEQLRVLVKAGCAITPIHADQS